MKPVRMLGTVISPFHDYLHVLGAKPLNVMPRIQHVPAPWKYVVPISLRRAKIKNKVGAER